MIDFTGWKTPAEKGQYGIYLGTWTNWSRGRVMGATLTLESQYGLLLLSFTATFVGFVASRFWRIITLILHRIYSTPEPRDALHHQRQVVLRNSLSAASTLWTSLQLAWSWRAVANGYLSRILPTIISAASALCAFTIAGGFTSSISTGIGNEVLIDGSQCATLARGSSKESHLALYPYIAQSMNNAANYAQQCYSSNTTGTLDCTTFVKSRLQFSSVLNASCPFSDNICRSNDSNLLLDSGPISSDEFGLNIPGNQRMFHRETLHCAPLRTDGFRSHVRTIHDNYTRYSYGHFSSHNYTYEVEDLDAQYHRQIDNPIWENIKGVSLIGLYSRIANGTVWKDRSDFVSIPQLTLSDADLIVVFLSSQGVVYVNQTDDPWYRGIVPSIHHYSAGQLTVYTPDEAASPLGCVLRYQYCNSDMKCGRLASYLDAIASALALFPPMPDEIWSDAEPARKPDGTNSRFRMFQGTMSSTSSLYEILITLGSSSLLSSQHLSQGFMGPLPDNQWQLDVSHWFAIRMASLQAIFVNTARGPTDEALLPYKVTPYDGYQWEMCKSQKILSTGFISLSLFGLYFTYMTGIVIILTSYIAEPLLAVFYSRRKYEEHKYLEWANNSTLQLQRLAYQGLGSEKWSNYTDDIPKTRPGYFLADLTRAYPLEDDNEEFHEVKTKVHMPSTTTPSESEATSSANLGVSGQSRGAPSRPVSAVSELVPQAISSQAISTQAISTQAVSPISSPQPTETRENQNYCPS